VNRSSGEYLFGIVNRKEGEYGVTSVETATQLADRIRAKANDMRRIGGYSVEAEAIMKIVDDLADLADKVAALEGLAKSDITQIIEAVLEGKKPPPVGEMKSISDDYVDGSQP
jgi:hypothetical protein